MSASGQERTAIGDRFQVFERRTIVRPASPDAGCQLTKRRYLGGARQASLLFERAILIELLMIFWRSAAIALRVAASPAASSFLT